MSSSIVAPDTSTASASQRPLVTRGLRREQEKRQRRRTRIPRDALILGIDLARKRQAASFSHDGQILGRRRLDCGGQEIDRFFAEAETLVDQHGLSQFIVAFEPAGLYWCLAAEACERAGIDYVLVNGLSVKREREITRYTPEKTDPRDADLISFLPPQGKFLETRLPSSVERDALAQLARDYFLIRKLSAAERTRLRNFWNRMLPEFFSVLRDPTSNTALAVAGALPSASETAGLSSRSWTACLRRAAQGDRIQLSRAAPLLALLKHADADPVRRSGEGMRLRIRHAAQRRRLLEAQKAEVNHYASGDWKGTSRISHRGRSRLRAAAYQQARFLVKRNDDYRARFYHLLHRTHRPNLCDLASYLAVMNSYLRTAHALVTRRQFYVPRAECPTPEPH